MPNWVFNNLAIEGDSKDVEVVKAQLNSPFSTNHMVWETTTRQYEPTITTYSNPVFSFWNIIRPTDLDTYYLQEDPNEDKTKLFSGDNWYSWNVRNWVWSWDVAIRDDDDGYKDTFLDESDGIARYRFDTAWSPPLPAIEKLSTQHPNLTFSLSFEEEQGWGGEIHYTNGEGKVIEEYDCKCYECDEIDNMDYCEDCGSNVCLACKITRDEGMCEHEFSR